MIDVKTDARFRVETETVVVDGLTRPFRLMQLSDAHLSVDSPLDTEDMRRKAARQREVWLPHGNGLAQEENFDLLTAYGRENGCELFAYAGDMMDFPSPGTADGATRMMDEAGDYVFAPGNHECAWKCDFYAAATNGNPACQVRDFGEWVMVAVDNAAHDVSDEALAALKAALYGDKPVVLLHHTPVDCETLHPAAYTFWEDPTYFLFGMPGDGRNTQEYIRLVSREHTQLRLVLAGHMHYDHVDIFDNGVKQMISAPCLAGYGRIIDLVPAE